MVLALSGALLVLGIGTYWVSNRTPSAGRDIEIEVAADDDADEAARPAAARPARERAAARPAPSGGIPAPDDVARPPASAETTASGLASRVLEAGTGTEHPTATSTVRVHYTGWQTDGTMFDSSVQRGELTL